MKMTFSVAGDMLVQRRVHKDSVGFKEVSAHLKKADVRYVNLETTLHRGEFYANQFSGGSHLRADPETLSDVKEYGFNMISFANNHSMDFDRGGLMATKKYVDEAGLVDGYVKWPDNSAAQWYYYNVIEATNSHDYEREANKHLEKWTQITENQVWVEKAEYEDPEA